MNTSRQFARLRVLNFAYGVGSPLVSDAEYDKLYYSLKKERPNHTLFDEVGYEYGVEHILPIRMGSLNKIRPNEIRAWLNKLNTSEAIVPTPKLDGLAVLLEYDASGVLRRAYSRGNGVKGIDITNSIKLAQNVPDRAYTSGCNLYVKGELILSKSIFKKFKKDKEFKYVNARNTLVGCVNAKEKLPLHKKILRNAEFFAIGSEYQVDPSIPHSVLPELVVGSGKVSAKNASKSTQLNNLKSLGFDTVFSILKDKRVGVVVKKNLSHIEEDSKETIINLRTVDYECDGIVLTVNAEKPYKFGYEANGLNPSWSRAVKLDPSEQESQKAQVKKIIWSVTPRGIFKPVVLLKKSLEFQGVKVERAYADNAKWIVDNRVGKKAQVSVIRSGDVIPRIINVNKPSKAKLPSTCKEHKGELVWTDTGTDLYCEVCSLRMNPPSEFFKHLNPDNIGKVLVEHVCSALSLETVKELLEVKPFSLKGLEKFSIKRSTSFIKELEKVIGEASLAKIMHASGIFRTPNLGLGETRIQLILDKFKIKKLMSGGYSQRKLFIRAQSAEGIGDQVADCFSSKFDQFIEFFNSINSFSKTAVQEVNGETKEGVLSDQKFVFTGFRNKDVEIYLKEEGGSISNSVSKTTSILFAGSHDTVKAKRAVELGVEVVVAHNALEHTLKLIKKLRKKAGLPAIKVKEKKLKNMTRRK